MKKSEFVLVLDLGSDFIKLLEAEKKDLTIFIKSFSITPVPQELQKIESPNEPAYVDFLKNILAKNKITAKTAILCLSNRYVQIKNIVLPEMSDKELAESVRWEIKDLINMPLEDAVCDFNILHETKEANSKKLKLSIAVISKRLSEEYVLMINSLGLMPSAFVIEQQTAWAALRNMPEIRDKRTAAFIDVGAEKSCLSIFENGRIELIRSLPVSGRKFTSSIASRVKTLSGADLTIDIAEIIKCKYGIAFESGKTQEDINPPDVFAALRPLLEELVSELIRVFEYYKNEHEGKNVELLVFYGGGATMKGLLDYISKNIEVPVLSANPFTAGNLEIDTSCRQGLIDAGCYFVNSVGCLLAGEKSINLLPERIKEGFIIRSLHRKWIKAWAILMLSVAVIYVPIKISGLTRQASISRLKKSYMELSVQKKDLDKYNKMVSELNDEAELCIKLIKEEPYWDNIMKELASAVPGDIVLSSISFSSEAKGVYTSAKLPFVVDGIVKAKGARPEDLVTKFLYNLEKSGYFKRVKLEFSKEGKFQDEKIIEFRIACEIK
jgi:type IV pilus assembly protein PilM